MTGSGAPEASGASVVEMRSLLAPVIGAEVIDGIGADELFFERGAVDSLQLLELVAALESRFGVQVEGDELTPENFGSLRALAGYVNAKIRR
jgi:acyl carrier protein